MKLAWFWRLFSKPEVKSESAPWPFPAPEAVRKKRPTVKKATTRKTPVKKTVAKKTTKVVKKAKQ